MESDLRRMKVIAAIPAKRARKRTVSPLARVPSIPEDDALDPSQSKPNRIDCC